MKVFHVCDLHFTPDCITRNFVEELVDGTENLVKRKRIGLKSGSIPTIFKVIFIFYFIFKRVHNCDRR